ncbi:MAG: gas vesicle protein GvpG [Streptosporangiaceae bacterium]|nr:gas vesicle protein GvpG [Streptosporangiaceae bacterium]MBV9857513.1 gas vesicle protein GvpG [Streptosporangiaceae bacterium]
MGLLTLPFRLPFLPISGFVRIAELIRDEAEREMHDPAAVRRQLEEAEQARDSGAISEDELSRIEAGAIGRLYATGEASAGRRQRGDRS